MKVESKYVINGTIVAFMVEFCGIKVYESGDDERNLYFVKNTMSVDLRYVKPCES